MTKETKELEALAADQSTSPEKLREIAAKHPSLRPIIAMNPSAYPGLLTWLAGLNDPAVNVALEQRRAMEEAERLESSGPQRVSVLQRSGGPSPASDTAPTAPPAFGQPAGAAPEQQVAQQAPQQGQVRPTVALDPEELAAAQEAEEKKKRRTSILRFGALAALLVVAIGILTWSLTRDDGDTTADPVPVPAQSEQQSAPVQEQEEPATTSDEETEGNADEEEPQEEPVVVYPAPENALELDHIVAPSGNIICLLGENGAVCSINAYSFTDASLANCANAPATLNTTADGTAVSCSVAPVAAPGATTLSYGDYAANDFGACYSTEYGMSCWNTTTGASFAVARGGFMTGTEGLIPVESMPWVG